MGEQRPLRGVNGYSHSEGCRTSLPYRHRLALQEGEVADVACARLGDPRGHQGLEGIGPQAIGTAGEVPPLEVRTCGVVHDL
jgi:hypothetical protein